MSLIYQTTADNEAKETDLLKNQITFVGPPLLKWASRSYRLHIFQMLLHLLNKWTSTLHGVTAWPTAVCIQGSKASAWMFDFSSAFNTVQPHILTHELMNNFNLAFNVVCWILDFLTKRVSMNGYTLDVWAMFHSSTLYTDDCRSWYNNRLVLKEADDSKSVFLRTINNPVVNEFVQWCDSSISETECW